MDKQKKRTGFALLTPEQRKALSGAAGRKAHAIGHAHQWTSAEAKAASKLAWEKLAAKKTDQ